MIIISIDCLGLIQCCHCIYQDWSAVVIMRFSKRGGFVIAFAVHGLLLSAVPTEQAPSLSSGASHYPAFTLSFSHQPLPVNKPTTSAAIVKASLEPSIHPDSTFNRTPLVIKPAQEKYTALLANKPQPTHVQKVVVAAVPLTAARLKQPAANPVPLTSAAGVHEISITEPIFSSSPIAPQYPQLARKRGQQGTVWVDVLLDEQGRQIRTDIFQSSGVSPLDRAALAAVKQWRFIAHRINDIAVTSRIRIPVEFSLD
jgi:protein TonB